MSGQPPCGNVTALTDAFVLDRAGILERLGGDDEIFAVMADTYLEDIDTNCANLQAALAGGDPAAVRRAAHTVKGLLGMFADSAGAAVALAVERQAREGRLAGLEWVIPRLQARLREVAAALVASQGG